MEQKEVEEVIKSAIAGNTQPFTLFFEKTAKTLLPKIQSLTKSKETAKEVFIIAMEKFWECFVINKQTVPHNSIGYIYIISKNIWLLQKEKGSRMTLMDTKSLEYHTSKTTGSSETNHSLFQSETDEQLLKHKALVRAIELLSPKCKTLIENDLDPDSKLKSLQKTLGYDTYQAMVQAKYNCKKKLTKKVYEVLVELKSRALKNEL